MKTLDISTISLLQGFLLLAIPLVISFYVKLGIVKRSLIGIVRMAGQLILIGFFLEYLFRWDLAWVNVLWVLGMLVFASLSVVRSSDLKLRVMFFPVFLAILITAGLMLFYYNFVILDMKNIFQARYFIVIGGMMLGNSLKSNIVTLSSFYAGMKTGRERYLFHLGMGATVREAVMPVFRRALNTAIAPTIATMATMGLVFIPGMMTGQILGGASAMTSVKYQITIMITIFSSSMLSAFLGLLFSLRRAFTAGGFLRQDIFIKEGP